MPPKAKAPAEAAVERLPGEEDRVVSATVEGVLRLGVEDAAPLAAPPEGEVAVSGLPQTELRQPFLRVLLPGDDEPLRTPCLASDEAAAEEVDGGVAFRCQLFRKELRPVNNAAVRSVLLQDVVVEVYARKLKQLEASEVGADDEKDRGKKPAPKKPKPKGQPQAADVQEEEVLVARAVVGFAPLVMGETAVRVRCGSSKGGKSRPPLPGFTSICIALTSEDPEGAPAQLLSPSQLSKLMPLCFSVVSVTDLPDCRPLALSRADDDGTQRPLADKISTQEPDYTPLRRECRGVTVRCDLIPGAPVVETPPLPHFRDVGVYYQRVFLLGDPAQLTDGKVPNMLALLQHMFQARVRVELHDRDMMVDPADPAAAGPQPHGVATFSLRSLYFDPALRPMAKVAEQVCPVRAAIDDAPGTSAAKGEDGGKARRIMPTGQYLQWGTTLTLKLELATRLPRLCFKEALAVGFDPTAMPSPSSPTAGTPEQPPLDTKPGTAAAGNRRSIHRASQLSRTKGTKSVEDLPLQPAARPSVPPEPVLVPVVPVLGRLVIVMKYESLNTGVVLRAVLGRLMEFEPARGAADDLRQYQPWRGIKPPKEPEAGQEKGKKPAPKASKQPSGSEEPAPTMERCPALEYSETPALRAVLHCTVTPRVSGFEVMDGCRRILAFEGLTTVILKELVAAVYKSCDEESLRNGDIKIVFHKDLGVPLRNYHVWPALVKDVTAHREAAEAERRKREEEEAAAAAADVKKGKGDKAPPSRGEARKPAAQETAAPASPQPEGPPPPDTDAGGVAGRIRRIRLREEIDSIACAHKNLKNYARRRLSEDLLRAVDALRSLTHATRMSDALERRMFPTAAQLIALERVYGTTLSTYDVCGDEQYQPFIGWTQQPWPQPPREADQGSAETVIEPVQKPLLSHFEAHTLKVLSANAECDDFCTQLSVKPTNPEQLARHLGEDVVLLGRPLGPTGGQHGVASAPPAYVPESMATRATAAAEGSQHWLEVPAVQSKLLLLLSRTPAPLRSLRLRVEGRLMHAAEPGTGRPVLAVRVYKWEEAQTGGLPTSLTRNPGFDSHVSERKRVLPYTNYRRLLEEDRREAAKQAEAREATRLREEAGDSSGSDGEDLGGEQARLELPHRKHTPRVATDHVWGNAHKRAGGGREPRPPAAPSATSFFVGTSVEALASGVAGAMVGARGRVVGQTDDGYLLVNFGSKGEALLSPRQLRAATATKPTVSITAFKQLSGGWRACSAAELNFGRSVRVWPEGSRLGVHPRPATVLERVAEGSTTVRVALTSRRAGAASEVVVPLHLIEVPAKFPPREPARVRDTPLAHELLSSPEFAVAAAAAAAAAIAAPRWRSRAVVSFAFSRPRPKPFAVDTVFGDSAAGRDPTGRWRVSGPRGGVLSVSRATGAKTCRADGELPLSSAAAAAIGSALRTAQRDDGVHGLLGGVMVAAEAGASPPEGLVGDAVQRRGLPGVWTVQLDAGLVLWVAMHDHDTMRTAIVSADGALVQWNTAVRPRERDLPAFRTHKKQDARKTPHVLDRAGGMLHDAPSKPGLGLHQPPLSIHAAEPTSPQAHKPQVSTVYYPSKRHRWHILENKDKRPIVPLPGQEKQGSLWGTR